MLNARRVSARRFAVPKMKAGRLSSRSIPPNHAGSTASSSGDMTLANSAIAGAAGDFYAVAAELFGAIQRLVRRPQYALCLGRTRGHFGCPDADRD